MCGKDSQTCLPFNCLMTYVHILKFHTHILQHVSLYNTITAAVDSFYIVVTLGFHWSTATNPMHQSCSLLLNIMTAQDNAIIDVTTWQHQTTRHVFSHCYLSWLKDHSYGILDVNTAVVSVGVIHKFIYIGCWCNYAEDSHTLVPPCEA